MKTLIRSVLRLALLSISLALAIHLVLTAIGVWETLSRSQVFSKIELGMSKGQVMSLLQEHRVSCETPPFSTDGDLSCKFSDYWREYSIVLNQESGRVSRKGFSFKSHKKLIDRITEIGR